MTRTCTFKCSQLNLGGSIRETEITSRSKPTRSSAGSTAWRLGLVREHSLDGIRMSSASHSSVSTSRSYSTYDVKSPLSIASYASTLEDSTLTACNIQLEDLNAGATLLPSDPKLRAHSRLWSDHINRHIIPAFYHYVRSHRQPVQLDLHLCIQIIYI